MLQKGNITNTQTNKTAAPHHIASHRHHYNCHYCFAFAPLTYLVETNSVYLLSMVLCVTNTIAIPSLTNTLFDLRLQV